MLALPQPHNFTGGRQGGDHGFDERHFLRRQGLLLPPGGHARERGSNSSINWRIHARFCSAR